ncbi:MAG: MauE/DoxX family redox-associated membrane protein [Mycobacterium sp.]|uniref:MauE/DoxX family redox-associated membrane protein n=1 Tax=Mycobacterium sp. TaxID=1785 RepID=UPI003BB17AE9
MGAAVWVARIALGAMFIFAGLTKLFDRAEVRRAVHDFGVPAPLIGVVAAGLPVVEMSLGITMFPSATARWSALGMIAVLVVFIAAIGAAIARGTRPQCRCFGQVHSGAVGWKTLARNGLLAATAAAVFWASSAGYSTAGAVPHITLTPWLLIGVLAAVIAAVVVQGWVIINLLRALGRLVLRLEALEAAAPPAPAVGHNGHVAGGLAVGSPAPEFSLPSLDGDTLTLHALRARERPVVLVFSDHACGPCAALLPEVAGWQDRYRDAVTIAVLSRGEVGANRVMADQTGVGLVLLQNNFEIAEAYRFAGTPSAALVTPDGRVGSPTVAGADAIRDLVSGVVSEQTRPHTQSRSPALGRWAPGFALPDLAARMVTLDDFRGDRVMLLFWNPDCGFCAGMLDDLKSWEFRTTPGAPRLLVISTGSQQQNRDIGLRAPILTDVANTVAPLFGVYGTPMAVMVDPEGKLSSAAAAGADAIFELARNLLVPAAN